MTDERAVRLLAALTEGKFVVIIKILREKNEGDWVVEDKFDPVRREGREGQGIVEIFLDTKPCVLTGIVKVFKKAYPVTAVVNGLYLLRDQDLVNLVPMHDGQLNCVAQSVVEYFESAPEGQGLSPTIHQKILLL